MRTSSDEQSITVESSWLTVGPASMAKAHDAPTCTEASTQVVGLGPPWRFALEATSGPPSAPTRSCTAGASGMRTPTVAPPASAGLDQPGTAGTMIVQPPGPKAS